MQYRDDVVPHTTGLELGRLPGESNLNSTRPKIPLLSRETALPQNLSLGVIAPHCIFLGLGEAFSANYPPENADLPRFRRPLLISCAICQSGPLASFSRIVSIETEIWRRIRSRGREIWLGVGSLLSFRHPI